MRVWVDQDVGTGDGLCTDHGPNSDEAAVIAATLADADVIDTDEVDRAGALR